MGLGQVVRGLSSGVLPAALGHCTRRPGLDTDLKTLELVPLFRISGGNILVTSFYGKVTTAIVNDVHIQLQETVTQTVAVENLCTELADIGADPVDTIYIITGDPGAAMLVSDQVGISDASMVTNLLILAPGVIGLLVSDTEATGVIDWTLHWVPLDFDSRVKIL